MTVVVGTAGHIDHGKTTLLRALTGIDADRLPEERRRGMTIDVGYAHLALPDGTELDFVDVPGHDRLVGNMLVGAGEIDAALLVVAADDGPRAQTLEHLELLDALGIRHGLAVVTKTDLAGEARTAAVVDGGRALLGRTTLAGSPVLPVSSSRGDGLDELRTRAARAARPCPGRPAASPAAAGVRLAIDRVFTIKGRGAVVTGSLRGGRSSGARPSGSSPAAAPSASARSRSTARAVDAVEGGGRVALNLAGVEAADLAGARPDDRPGGPRDRPPAGDPPATGHARRPGAAAGLAARDRGDGPAPPRDRVGRRDACAAVGATRPTCPTAAAWRRCASPGPIAAAVGDPFVLRVPSPAATAAGGLVLDVAPPVGASRRGASPEALVALAAAWTAGDAGR